MRAPFNRLTLLSLLVATSLSTPSLLANAKGVTSLEPQTGWKQTKADTYCTMTQRYMDNVVLNYARNNRGERSIALDMQASRFTPGKEVPVQVRAGSASRSYMLTPNSDSLMVINLGGGDEMEKAIADGQKVDVIVNGETFRVNTAEFKDATGQLGSCVTTLPNAPQAPAQNAMPSAPQAAAMALASEKASRREGDDVFQPEIAPPAKIEVPPDIAQLESALEMEKPAPKVIPPTPKLAAAPAVPAAPPVPAAKTTQTPKMEAPVGDVVAAVQAPQPATKVAAAPQAPPKAVAAPPQEKLKVIQPRDRSQDIARAKAEAQMAAQAKAEAEAQAKAQAQMAAQAKAQAEAQKMAEAKAKADLEAKAQAEAQMAAQAKVEAEAQKMAEAQAEAKLAAEKKAAEAKIVAAPATPPQTAPVIKPMVETASADKPKEAGASRDYYTPKPQSKLVNAQVMNPGKDKKEVAKVVPKEEPKAPVVTAMSDKTVKNIKTEVPKPKVSRTDVGFVDFTETTKKPETKEIVGAKPFAQFDNSAEAQARAAKPDGPTDSLGPLEDEMQALKLKNDALENELVVARSQTANMPASDEDNTLPGDESLDVVIPVGERKQVTAPVPPQTAEARYAEAQREIQRLGLALKEEKARRVRDREELTELIADPQMNGTAADQQRIALLEEDLTNAQAQLDQLKKRMNRRNQGGIEPNPYDFDGDGTSVFGGEFYNADKQLAKRTGAGYELPSTADRRNRASGAMEVTMAGGYGSGKAPSSLAIDESLLEDGAPSMPKAKVNNVEVASLAPPPAPVRAQPIAAPRSADTNNAFAQDPIAAEMQMRGTPLPNKTSSFVGDVVSVSKPSALSAPATPKGAPRYWQTTDYQQLLKSAGLPLKGGVALVPTAQSSSVKMYRWQSDRHTGTAEQQPLSDPAGYDIMMQTYIDRYKARCGGEFAADPTDVPAGVGGKANGYEIACVSGGGKGSGASLLFFARDGLFTVIALEGAPDAMAEAMDERDRLLQTLGSKSS